MKSIKETIAGNFEFLKKLVLFALAGVFLIYYGQVDPLKIALIGAGILVVMTLMNEMMALMMLVLLGFTMNFAIEAYHFPAKLAMGYDFLIYLLFLYSLINGKKRMHFIEVIAFIYILFLVFTTVNGREQWGLKLKDFIIYVRYPIMFLMLMRLKLRSADFKLLIKFVLILSILQVPTSIFQFASGNIADWCGGFLARYGSGINAILMTFMFLLVLSLVFINGFKLRYVFYALALMIPLILSSARAGFIFFFIALIFMLIVYIFFKKYSSSYSMFFSIIGMILIFVLFYYVLIYVVPIFEPKTANTYKLLTSSSLFSQEVTGNYTTGSMKRLTAVFFAYNFIRTDPLSLFIGSGPGTIAYSENYGASSFIEQFQNYGTFTISLPSFIVEIGIIGVSLLIIMFIYVVILSLSRGIYIEDKFLRMIAYALPGMSIIMIVASVYTNVWDQEALQLTYWLFVASIFEPAYSAYKKDPLVGIIFLNDKEPADITILNKAVNHYLKYDAERIYICGQNDDMFLQQYKGKLPSRVRKKIYWILTAGYDNLGKCDILNLIVNKHKADILVSNELHLPGYIHLMKDFVKAEETVIFEDMLLEPNCKKRVKFVKIMKKHVMRMRSMLKEHSFNREKDCINSCIDMMSIYGIEVMHYNDGVIGDKKE